ncbi:hypothetical protein M6B24_24975, partial [Enterobacter bugandensis]|nr:hypothetical protein [Enterobacter bugandensis]
GELYAREWPEMPSSVHWWRKASRMTIAGDKPLLSWAMDYASWPSHSENRMASAAQTSTNGSAICCISRGTYPVRVMVCHWS